MIECPCKDCIVLAMCKMALKKDPVNFLRNIENRCHLLSAYILENHRGYQISFKSDSLIETGKHLGYEITKKGAGPRETILTIRK